MSAHAFWASASISADSVFDQEALPSPELLPGAYIWNCSAPLSLKLPPAFLDDEASTPESFEALLRERQSSRTKRRLGKAPTQHHAGQFMLPNSLLAGASKFVSTLGEPPGRKPRRKTILERRKERAERALRGIDYGEQLVGKLKRNLSRKFSQVSIELGSYDSDEQELTPQPMLDEAIVMDSLRPASNGLEQPMTPFRMLSQTPLEPLYVPDKPKLVAQSSYDADISPIIPTFDEKRRKSSHEISPDRDYFAFNPKCESPTRSLHRRRSKRTSHTRPVLGSRKTTAAIYNAFSTRPRLVICSNVLSELFLHVFGFIFFILSHLILLIISTAAFLQSTSIFLYWLYLNLAAKTEFGVTCRQCYRSYKKVWQAVADEEGFSLSTFSVLVGLVELAAIQNMLRKRFFEISLIPILGDHTAFSKEEEGDTLMIMDQGDTILEATLLSPTPRLAAYTGADLEEVHSPLSLGTAATSLMSSATAFRSAIPALPQVTATGNRDRQSLQRYCRFATATYGLKTFVVPDSPLFTPSGHTLPHSVFTHLTQLPDKRSVLHCAIQKNYDGTWDQSTSPAAQWQPTFYLLRDLENAEIVLVFRGTQSLQDIIIDLQSGDCEWTLPAADGEGAVTHRCHMGLLRAVERLLQPDTAIPLISKLKKALLEHPTFSLVLTGHSLGAGVAFILAAMISTYDKTSASWKTSATGEIPAGRSIRAVCFAPPAVCDQAFAQRCLLGDQPLVTSVIVGVDVVPRIGLPQIKEVRRKLGWLNTRRKRLFRDSILSAWWRYRKALSKGNHSEMDRLRNKLWPAYQHLLTADHAVESLLPPGQVVQIDSTTDDELNWTMHTVKDPLSFFSLPCTFVAVLAVLGSKS